MDLQDYAEHYNKFLHKTYILTAARKSKKVVFKLSFQGEHFHHLLGLHKAVDLPDIANVPNKNVFFKKALVGKIRPTLKDSSFFSEITKRASCLMRIDNLLHQNIIIHFDKRKAYTAISAQLLLYEKFEQDYIHLFFAPSARNGVFLPCSLFATHSDKYIYHQEIYKILDIQVEVYKKETALIMD